MGNAAAALGWPPDRFWSSTLQEYTAAIEAYNRANSPAPDAPRKEEFADWKEEVEAGGRV